MTGGTHGLPWLEAVTDRRLNPAEVRDWERDAIAAVEARIDGRHGDLATVIKNCDASPVAAILADMTYALLHAYQDPKQVIALLRRQCGLEVPGSGEPGEP